MEYCVYKHTSPSGKVYIGITKQKTSARWKNGLGYKSSPHFYAAIEKYGWDAFTHEIVKANCTEESACELEKQLIAEYKSTDSRYGYNSRTGGETGAKFSAECEAMRRAKMKEYWSREESREAASKRTQGFHHSEETKARLREIKRGIKLPPHTEEWKKQISELAKVRYQDPSTRAQLAEMARANGLKNSIPIIQFDTDGNKLKEYPSAKEAERQTGIACGNIRRACVQGIKAGGYLWQNATEHISVREDGKTQS